MKAYWYDNLPVRISLYPTRATPQTQSTRPSLHKPNTYQSQGDQREAHDSGRPVDPAYLEKLGVLYYNLPSLDDVNVLAKERDYKNRDEITVSPTTLPNYEEKVKGFFHEHLHEDEEIRYIRDGGGFFDLRGKEDEWIRISLEKNDVSLCCCVCVGK